MNRMQRKEELANFNTKLLLLRSPEISSSLQEKPFQKTHNDSMMGAIEPALRLARLFGVLPIPNLDSDFRWKSFRSIHALIIMLSLLIEALLSIARLAVIGVSFQSSVNAVFFCINLTAACIFLKLAMSWKSIARCWDYVEQNEMRSYGWPKNLRRNTLCMTIFIISCGLVDFCLSAMSTIAEIWPCTKKHGLASMLERFFLLKFAMTFYVTNYALWKGFILFLIQLVSTFVWNFVDLMIILMSMALSARFRLLNELIFSSNGQERPHEFWRRARETYFTLAELTRETDRRLGTLILLSFAGNLYFICLQLMHSVSVTNLSIYYDIYFAFSVIFLALRTFLVGVMAAAIYEESKRPKEILYNVPTENYSVEVDRFLKQVCSDQIAMTGRNFFAITRSILLTVAGTVVTYEIILVQFNPGSDPDSDSGLVSSNITLRSCKQ